MFVGNEVCPNTEHEKINSGTTGTENTHTETNGTTDDVDQAQYHKYYEGKGREVGTIGTNKIRGEFLSNK